MMRGIEAAFSGRLGAISVRTDKNGNEWLSMSVAVGDGDTTEWVRVALFGSSVADVKDRLQKGDRAYVEGRATIWRSQKDGKEQASLNVAAWLVQPLGQIGSKKSRSSRTRGQQQHAAKAPPSDDTRHWQAPPKRALATADDPIPF